MTFSPQIKAYIRNIVKEELAGLFVLDPDAGLQLNENTSRQLRRSLKSKREGQYVTLEEVGRKLRMRV